MKSVKRIIVWSLLLAMIFSFSAVSAYAEDAEAGSGTILSEPTGTQAISVANTSITIPYGDTKPAGASVTGSIPDKAPGALSYAFEESSASEYITLDASTGSMKATAKTDSIFTLKITAAATEDYPAAYATVKVGTSAKNIADLASGASASKMIFNDADQLPDISVSNNGTALVKDKDFTVDNAYKQKNPGNYTVTVEGIGNYYGTLDLDWSIVKGGTVSVKYGTVSVGGKSGTKSGDKYIISAEVGEKVTAKADAAPAGMTFDCWSIEPETLDVSNDKTQEISFDMIEGNVELIATYLIKPYKFTAGKNQVFVLKSGKSLSFTCDGEYTDLTSILVNNVDIMANTSYYSVKSGPTVLTLKNSFLEKLKVGKYSLQLKYKDGESDTIYFQVRAAGSAKTGDDSNIALWSSVAFISVAAAAAVVFYMKKRRVC